MRQLTHLPRTCAAAILMNTGHYTKLSGLRQMSLMHHTLVWYNCTEHVASVSQVTNKV